MSEDLIFETKDDRRFAPSSNFAPPATVDDELEAEFAKIPDKMAFKIGEVAEIVGVKPYVLRYWESEFEALKPQKSKHNQRMYDRKAVETVLMIKKLLYRDRFSIEGARSALKRLRKDNKKQTAIRTSAEHIETVIDRTQDLLVRLSNLKALLK